MRHLTTQTYGIYWGVCGLRTLTWLFWPCQAPTYFTEKDPTSPDGSTCILRIHAGPPYEDMAFRIVNKEWEYSHKKGFKCTFERGIFHLYFNFKRIRYRR
jgi:Cactus-binding C-terminus of cactin protein